MSEKAIRFDHSANEFNTDYDFIGLLNECMKHKIKSEDIIRKLILPRFVFQNIDDYIDFLEMNEKILYKNTGGNQ